jgi:hypothetical protein
MSLRFEIECKVTGLQVRIIFEESSKPRQRD